MRSRQSIWFVAIGLLVAARNTPTSGSVTIETKIDFSSQPFHGTFNVTEGEDILGCSSGTFVDTPAETVIHKAFTCENGSREGTFTAGFNPDPDAPGPGDDNSPWSILEGTGDYAGLEGEGDFWAINDPDGGPTGIETLRGEIEFTS